MSTCEYIFLYSNILSAIDHGDILVLNAAMSLFDVIAFCFKSVAAFHVLSCMYFLLSFMYFKRSI